MEKKSGGLLTPLERLFRKKRPYQKGRDERHKEIKGEKDPIRGSPLTEKPERLPGN